MRTFGSPVRTLFAKAFAAFFAFFSQSLSFCVMLKERSITRTMSVFFVDWVGCSPVTLMVIFAIPAFSSTHCADFSSFGPVVFPLVVVLTAVCAAGGSASAAIAEIGIMPTSISTASTMLKKRFFMFFFPPVSNFLMCFDAFLSAKVSCVSLYQNFSRMQVPKHPSKRPEILVLSSFPLKNSRF